MKKANLIFIFVVVTAVYFIYVFISSALKKTSCICSDGSHRAKVMYYNPETAFYSVYSLNIEVKDCNVTMILFPKGGWLDKSHITNTKITAGATASVRDDNGVIYDMQIELP